MKIKQIGNLKGSHNFMEEFLASRNIENLTNFLYPKAEFMLDPTLLDNMQEGALCYLKHVDCNDKITIVVDSDCDGFTSAAMIYNYTKMIDPNAQISWLIHEGKQHGVEDLVEAIIDKEKPNLLILPDSGTNDSDYCREIKANGIDILVLDHHIQDRQDNPAIIINNQSSKNYTNKDLCGAGVVYKFCKYIDSWAGYNYADHFIDLAAMGIIGDMMAINGLENRYIISTGLKNINNFLFDSFLEKQSFSMGDKITPIGIAFYIVPLINGMIRVGTQEEKEILFEAFINPMKQVPSTKRGHKEGDMENICAQAVRICANAKNRQDKLKEKISELIDLQVQNYCLDQHKIIIIDGSDIDYDSELTGLIAMQLSSKYHKPILLGKMSSDGILKGSIRNCANSPISGLKSFLLTSNMFDYVTGHENAAGFGINAKRIDNFIEWADQELKDINFNEGCFEVDIYTNAMDEYLNLIVSTFAQFDEVYGQGFQEPIIAISDIILNKKEITIMGKNNDTIKFIKNGITYVIFRAKSLIEEIETSFDTCFNFTVIGKANMNEWGGNINPQILVNNYQFMPIGMEF